jgi:hypothetical protein
MKLVEVVGAHADGEEECDQGGGQPATVESGGDGCADRNV